MSNAYVSLTAFKERLGMSGTADDATLRRLLEAVSREIDRFCGRHFFVLNQKRYFTGNGSARLLLPWDLIAVATLKEDTSGDGTYNKTWAVTDYELWPYEADPVGDHDAARPYLGLEVNLRSNGHSSGFFSGQKRYELDGRWGYCERLETRTALGAALDAASTTVSVTNGAALDVLDTILVDAEQMYVTAISGDVLTVERGRNGTVAAGHANGATVRRYLYPAPVVEAAMMQAGRLWTRRAAGYANQIGFTETGATQPLAGLDRDVRELLVPYVKLPGRFA